MEDHEHNWGPVKRIKTGEGNTTIGVRACPCGALANIDTTLPYVPEGTVPPGYRQLPVEYADKGIAALSLLQDLDRSEHGRHRGDSEFQTEGGVSLGNPHLKTGDCIGYHISGMRIVVPDERELGDPRAWLRPKEPEGPGTA